MSKTKFLVSVLLAFLCLSAAIYGAVQLRNHNLRAKSDAERRLVDAVNARGHVLQFVSLVYARTHPDDITATFLVCDARPGQEGQIITVTAYAPDSYLPVEISTRPPLESTKCSNPKE